MPLFDNATHAADSRGTRDEAPSQAWLAEPTSFNPRVGKPSVSGVGAWIVAIAREADRASFLSLFTCFGPKVKGYLVRHGVTDQNAEELTQEVFLAVWRKAGQFDPARASAPAWIYTIARNLWIDHLRRARYRGDSLVDEPPVAQATPEDCLQSSELEARLRDALGALPCGQAQILRLAYFEELTHVEISAHLGLSLGTVKSRIRLATARLRSALNGVP